MRNSSVEPDATKNGFAAATTRHNGTTHRRDSSVARPPRHTHEHARAPASDQGRKHGMQTRHRQRKGARQIDERHCRVICMENVGHTSPSRNTRKRNRRWRAHSCCTPSWERRRSLSTSSRCVRRALFRQGRQWHLRICRNPCSMRSSRGRTRTGHRRPSRLG